MFSLRCLGGFRAGDQGPIILEVFPDPGQKVGAFGWGKFNHKRIAFDSWAEGFVWVPWSLSAQHRQILGQNHLPPGPG